ncbi:MAG: heme ABC transporter ATP-binding protein [Myxococcales bacterium]|nr:heme ABC transporter ATP-binding protein [Myxococcales bacterium]
MIAAETVTVRAGDRALLDRVSVEARCGEVLAILGPNGAGKSTLLRALSGEREPDAGRVCMGGRRLSAWTLVERARVRAVVPQESALAFPLSVLDVVLMGRTPHVQRRETVHDEHVGWLALQAVGLSTFATRRYPTLSGGEKQRVHLARALAQIWDARGERYLLLDEPTSGLDIAHQHEALSLLRRLAHDLSRTAVAVVLHDLNLAAQYADRILLMRGGQAVACGSPTVVLTEENLRRILGVEAVIVPHPRAALPLVVPLSGNALAMEKIE